MSNQSTVLIAATSQEIALGLASRVAPVCHEQGIKVLVGPSGEKTTFDDKDELFSCLLDLGPSELLDTLVVLHVGHDYGECFESRLHSRSSKWHRERLSDQGVALELILRFPQLFPVFATASGGAFEHWLTEWITDARFDDKAMLNGWFGLHFVDPLSEPEKLQKILKRFSSGLRTCFDPTGLRTLVRNRFVGQVFGSIDDWNNSVDARGCLNVRLYNLVVVIDEEPELALFAGYTAYKFGARAWMITSFNSLTESENPCWQDGRTSNVTIVRDLDLRFADYPDSSGMAGQHGSLRKSLRDVYSVEWQRLRLPSTCVVRALSYDARVSERRHQFTGESLRLGQRPETPTEYYGIKKPLRSIYSLAEIFGFSVGCPLLSNLPRAGEMEGTGGHGAPYQNLRIAWELLDQAAKCRMEHEVRASILAALLAQEAYSLLLGMSETSCLQAIREMSLGEASAEGEFAGVAHTVGIRERRNDLERTVRNLKLKDNGANFLARVWAELRLVYKQSEQFEASEEANSESLINSIWVLPWPRMSSWLRRVKRVLVTPVRSLGWLLAVVFIWPLILTALHCLAYGWVFSPDVPGLRSFVDLYHHVFMSIIRPESLHVHGINPLESESFLKSALDMLMSMTSLMFVGLIVTVLFRKSTRG
jgi:hypothetical protein